MADEHVRSRYSDKDLDEFRAVIEDRLEKAKIQLENIQEQIYEVTENGGDEHGGDWVDDSGFNTDMELLNTMAIRQRKYTQDLDNALVRIRNKTYGICVISGNLIPIERLRAVPTTTKSLSVKTEEQEKAQAKKKHRVTKLPYVRKREIYSKIVKKTPIDPSKVKKQQPKISIDDDDDEDEDDFFDEDMEMNEIDSSGEEDDD